MSCQKVDVLNEKMQKLVTLAKDNTNRLCSIVDKAIKLEDLEMNNTKFDFKEYNLMEIINQSILNNNGKAKSNNIEIISDLSKIKTLAFSYLRN